MWVSLFEDTHATLLKMKGSQPGQTRKTTSEQAQLVLQENAVRDILFRWHVAVPRFPVKARRPSRETT